MAAFRDVTEISAWQLAHKLNLRVDLFLLSPDFRRHYKHSDRLSAIVQSAPRAIAEGFDSDRHGFVERVRLAKGSHAEVLHHLNDAYDQRLITLDELQIAQRLTRRAIKAANGLIRSLEATSGDVAAPATRRSRRLIRTVPTDLD
jgi:four helix bundle protein